MFFYVGEAILHYHPRLFFKHRGMEKRFEGLAPERGVVLAERVSGVGSVAHALAYCQAVEAAAGCTVPPRAHFLRVVLAEMERLYNHLHYLGHLCHTTTLKVGEADGQAAGGTRQAAQRAADRQPLPAQPALSRRPAARSRAEAVARPPNWMRSRDAFAAYARHMENTDSHLDRLITTGQLDRAAAFDQGATGPVERASGLDRDLRRDHPYAAYAELPLQVAVREEGDAHARAQVRMAEVEASIALIQRAARHLAGRAAARRLQRTAP